MKSFLVYNEVHHVKQKQEQIKKNNQQINKIISDKKFYLKHKTLFEVNDEINENVSCNFDIYIFIIAKRQEYFMR